MCQKSDKPGCHFHTSANLFDAAKLPGDEFSREQRVSLSFANFCTATVCHVSCATTANLAQSVP